jgi:hypothetical protein
MNPAPEPEMPNDEKVPPPPPEEFAEWLKADSAHQEQFAHVMERVVNGEYGELPPEIRAAAERAVAKVKVARQLKTVRDKFHQLMAVMQRPAGSMLAEERLAQCHALMDELTDALLETPEPHRSAFLKELLPIREEIRTIKLD